MTIVDTRSEQHHEEADRRQPPPGEPGVSPKDLAGSVYRFFHNKRTGLVLILALAVLTLAGILFPQAPDEVRQDPASYARWLDSIRPQTRGWTGPLDWLGVFTMFGSPVFKTATGMLMLSIIACTCHRTPLLWRQATRPHLHVPDAFFGHAALSAELPAGQPAGAALDLARKKLHHSGFRTVDDPKDGNALYADRFRFAPFGTVIAHIAFVVILLGTMVSAGTGFRDNEFKVSTGTRAPVGHGTSLELEVISFSDTYTASGRPLDYVSDVVLYDNGTQVAHQEVRVNQPLRWKGVKFNQSSFGTSADLKITDGAGKPLFAKGVPLDWTTEDELNTYGKFDVPGKPLQVYVIGVASGKSDPRIAPGQVRIEVYPADSNRPVGGQTLDPGKPVTIDGLTYTFERERKYTAMMVSRDPGAAWVWVGCGLLVVGTCLTMFLRHHRIWVRARTGQDGRVTVLMASPDRKDTAFQSRFRRLAGALEEELSTERPGNAANR